MPLAYVFICLFFCLFKGSRNVSDSGDLTFDPIQRDDAGNYVCYASNDLDSLSSKQLEVKVMCKCDLT